MTLLPSSRAPRLVSGLAKFKYAARYYPLTQVAPIVQWAVPTPATATPPLLATVAVAARNINFASSGNHIIRSLFSHHHRLYHHHHLSVLHHQNQRSNNSPAAARFPNKSFTTTTSAKMGSPAEDSSSSSTSPSSAITEITSKSQFDTFIRNNPRVALQVHADWCGPCKAMSPIFARLPSTHAGVAFARFNTDDVPDLTQELGIRSIPAFFFFKDGDKDNSVAGASPKALQDAVSLLAQ